MKASVLLAGLAAGSISQAVSIPSFVSNAFSTLQSQSQQVFGGGLRYLIETGPEPDDLQWVTEAEKWALKRQGKKFFDLTYNPWAGAGRLHAAKKVKFPEKVEHNDTIHELIKELDKEQIRANLEKFTSFYTRYYKSDWGRQSSEWLLNRVNHTLQEGGYGAAFAFKHDWVQSSVIATLPGKSDNTIVIGAHQDSVNMFLPSLLGAPGADDDGSGTTTILEALRVLLKDERILQGKHENTIEFHWYSAEEGGLLGSQAIFSEYEKVGRNVKAMLQQDMTGYIQGTLDAGKPESVGVITDFVDEGLTEFIKKVVEAYCTIPWVETKCGYACSDHASASKAGYPSAFVIESSFALSDKRIHTTDDKIEYLSFDHMLQHARLTLGLVYELAFTKFDD